MQPSVALLLLLLIISINACGRKHHEDDPQPLPPAYEEALNDGEMRLRGYREISELVEASLFERKTGFTIASYVGGDDYSPGLAPLLGYYEGSLVAPGWRNSGANTINSTVLFLALDGLARDLARICHHDATHELPLKQSVRRDLDEICINGDNASRATFQSFWVRVTAGVVPVSEFQPWLEDLKTNPDAASQEERFSHMVITALANPYFIFKN